MCPGRLWLLWSVPCAVGEQVGDFMSCAFEAVLG